MKNHVTKTGKLLGGWVPEVVDQAVNEWIQKHPERDRSTFVREAARELLRKDGIPFSEHAEPATN